MNKLAFGYNTNGFAHHDLLDVFEIVSRVGYQGVALTLDYNHCNPHLAGPRELDLIKSRLAALNLRVVVETGARFILDPWNKHEPGLVSVDNRKKRVLFTKKAIDIAAHLGAEGVVFASGRRTDSTSETACWTYLRDAVVEILDYADSKNIVASIEPEPGMFIDTLRAFDELRSRLPRQAKLFLTLDIGHLYCSETVPAVDQIVKYREFIKNVHIEDIRGGIHEHLPFGDGEIDFHSILTCLEVIGYTGLVNVELSRNSHCAVEMAKKSFQILTTVI
ncbi:MAG: sugar phosphate isomerase/epimerase [Nitrospirota bacterium]|nr:sugar phosphate isomerase/epimerase [Nitrospirota bacterium]